MSYYHDDRPTETCPEHGEYRPAEPDPFREPPSAGSDAIVGVTCLECGESWSSSARYAGDDGDYVTDGGRHLSSSGGGER
jgi:hypothetical protein